MRWRASRWCAERVPPCGSCMVGTTLMGVNRRERLSEATSYGRTAVVCGRPAWRAGEPLRGKDNPQP